MKYLRFLHPNRKICYIGRVRTTEEAMGEFNKPETKEDYQRALEQVVKEIKQLIEDYSNSKIGSVIRIVRVIRSILTKYGY